MSQKFQSIRTFAVYEGYDAIPEDERRYCFPTTDELIEDRYLETFLMLQGPLGLLLGDEDDAER